MITLHKNSIYCVIQIHMKEIIKKILIEWQESKLPEIVERDYSFDKDFSQILAIIWPRRAGKTFFMYQIISWLLKKHAKSDILFVNFEDYRLIDLQTKDLTIDRCSLRIVWKETDISIFWWNTKSQKLWKDSEDIQRWWI